MLLDAFATYWDIRKLPSNVSVIDEPCIQTQQTNLESAVVDPCIPTQESHIVLQSQPMSGDIVVCHDEQLPTCAPSGPDNTQEVPAPAANPEGNTHEAAGPPIDVWSEHDEVEYVGVDDEKTTYKDLVSDVESESYYIPDSDDEDQDDCAVDDEVGSHVLVCSTDLENPRIDVGVKFEDGYTFRKAIRQDGILNEIEIGAHYNESTCYRGYCKAKKCKWRIHASQLPDG